MATPLICNIHNGTRPLIECMQDITDCIHKDVQMLLSSITTRLKDTVVISTEHTNLRQTQRTRKKENGSLTYLVSKYGS